MIVSGFRAALDLIRPRCAERLNPVEVFTPYLPNAVVLAKSPRSFSCPSGTEAVGIAYKPPSSLLCENSRRQTDGRTDKQTHRTTTVTLAAHARRGLITSMQYMEPHSQAFLRKGDT